jgi:hypothetical protein
VKVLPEKPLPKVAYFTPLDRDKSDKLLEVLAAETTGKFTKVIGHTFGLGHRPTVGRSMQDAGGKIATIDGESGKPCEASAVRMPVP